MVIWNQKNFKDLGIIVEYIPKISKPKKRITQYEVPGRNGFLSVDEGTYEAFSLQLECHAKEGADYNEICSFLDGYGTLSFDGKKQYTAIINNSIEFEKVQMFKKFIVSFLVNPICEDIQAKKFNVTSSGENLIINDTYADIEPVITLTCSGNISITINHQTFYLNNTSGTYILDCKEKEITKAGINSSNLMNGNFIKLSKGINTIEYTGAITEFFIEYKKTYLIGV